MFRWGAYEVAFTFLVFRIDRSLSGHYLGQPTSANLSGQVTDDSGAAIPDPTVTIVDTSTGATSHAQIVRANISCPDSQGAYVITGLAPRVYRLTFTRKGFDSYTQEGLTIGVGQHATVNAHSMLVR